MKEGDREANTCLGVRYKSDNCAALYPQDTTSPMAPLSGGSLAANSSPLSSPWRPRASYGQELKVADDGVKGRSAGTVVRVYQTTRHVICRGADVKRGLPAKTLPTGVGVANRGMHTMEL